MRKLRLQNMAGAGSEQVVVIVVDGGEPQFIAPCRELELEIAESSFLWIGHSVPHGHAILAEFDKIGDVLYDIAAPGTVDTIINPIEVIEFTPEELHQQVTAANEQIKKLDLATLGSPREGTSWRDVRGDVTPKSIAGLDVTEKELDTLISDAIEDLNNIEDATPEEIDALFTEDPEADKASEAKAEARSKRFKELEAMTFTELRALAATRGIKGRGKAELVLEIYWNEDAPK